MPDIKINLSKQLFNDVYFPSLLDYSHRYEVYFGGAGSGKSHFVFQKAVVKALNNYRKILVVRKVARTNRDSTFQMCIDTLSIFKILSYCNINQSNMSITLPNGSVFLFYGCDDSEKLKSIAGITDIICEECTELDIDDVTQLNLRLRANTNNLQMTFMFNPCSKANWVYKRWYSDGVAIGDDTFVLKTTYLDNKFLPTDYITSLEKMRETNPTMYKIYTLGEFTSLDKLVFNNFCISNFNRFDIKGKLLVGLDFGFTNDPTTLICSILDEENKTIYVFDEYYNTGLINNDIANIITAKGYSKSIIIADCAEQKSIEEIRRLGVCYSWYSEATAI